MAQAFYRAISACHFTHVQFLVDSGLSTALRRNNMALFLALNIQNPGKRQRMFMYLLKSGANYWKPDAEAGEEN